MLEKLIQFIKTNKITKVIVSGPQRSGTTICSKILSKELNFLNLDESSFLVHDENLFFETINKNDNFCIQCPGMSHLLHKIDIKNAIIVFMNRASEEIYASEDRIGWNSLYSHKEFENYNIEFKDKVFEKNFKRSSDMKYYIWNNFQKNNLNIDSFNLNYNDLSSSKLFIKKSLRKKFHPKQTDFGKPQIIDLNVYEDDRGCFFESYNKNTLNKVYRNFVQDNVSYSKQGVIRGMHYQWDDPMGKLVSCLEGSINDFIVNICENSEDYGKVFKFSLNSKERKSLWVPEGYAHGFEVLSNFAIVTYKCSSYYNKDGESGICPFDETLNIPWETKRDSAIVSHKDLNAKSFLSYKQNPKF